MMASSALPPAPSSSAAKDALKVVALVGIFMTPYWDALWASAFLPFWWPARLLAYLVILAVFAWDAVLGLLLVLWAMSVVVVLKRVEIQREDAEE